MKNVLLNKLFKEFILEKNKIKLRELIDTFHIADIAEIISRLSSYEREAIYIEMNPEELSELIIELQVEFQEEIISIINNTKLKKVLENMSNDDIVDIFGDLSEVEVHHLMKLLDKEDREEVEKLSSHERDTAGGLMTTDYFSIPSGTKIVEVIAGIKKIGEEAELIYYVYVTAKNTNKLIGIASLRDIIISNPNITIDQIMEKNIISVKPETDQEKVAAYFSKYDLLAIPVLDQESKILGIITFDDILDVIKEEATEDIYTMAGLTEEDLEENQSVFSAVKIRLPWLMVSLVGEMISATILSKYNSTLQELVQLSFFIPLIMAMGGNSGSQSSAVMVRKIALGEIDDYKFKKMLFKESFAGIILGIISGTVVGIIALLWQKKIELSLIIGFALFIAISWAAIFGTFMPIIFNKFKIDPAVASGPFITTLNDVGGILIYFTLATIMLSRLTS